ncbi:unnamed protein product [Paramecium pentaurelia]|uniref:Uncharacterized protein n=1 Tax=Paramecium pentaurelia TaxID=43138 RepID=A0A8S1UXN0_9CILI|nr:unnamed protein product [Paramecium pentaurelia]
MLYLVILEISYRDGLKMIGDILDAILQRNHQLQVS